jgi:lipoyl(octanoyl) transferase
MRALEEVIIRTIAHYGIKGDRLPGSTGVWLDVGTPDARKICAMGVRCSRWVTMHGFALNVNTDLKYFDYIVPCGITDKTVTSMSRELGREIDEQEVKDRTLAEFAHVFETEIQPMTEEQLGLLAPLLQNNEREYHL